MDSMDYVEFYGIESNADYPYTSGETGFDGTCTEDREKTVFKSGPTF